jgi:hypothetical protein
MSMVLSGRNLRTLRIHPRSVSYARAHVAEVLAGWGREDLTFTAQLVIAELTTNALKATIGYYEMADRDAIDFDEIMRATGAHHSGRIEIDVYRSGDSVILQVWDCSRAAPKVTHADDDATCGRGLQLVSAEAADWGHHLPKTGGKIVYAVLRGSA